MLTPTPANRSFSFDRFVVQASQRQLLIDGEPARVGSRAFDVLLALIEHRERAVSKNELLDLVWPNLVVEENNLQVHISTLRKLLGPTVISTVPGCGYRFSAAVSNDQAAPGAAAGVAITPTTKVVAVNHNVANSNLPADQATLFGRDADVLALNKMLADHRLVSIVGAAGIGKTSVAVAVAKTLAPKFSDGVWLIELAAVSDSDLVIEVVASTLQLTLRMGSGAEAPPQQLAELISKRLGDREMLIVFDNCEHQLESVAAIVTAINHAAPRIRILITSQEALKLPREQVCRLSTLEIPDAATEEEKIADARATGAVALFEARARSVDSRFRVNAENLDAVIEICRRLDGIALAIELAAARVPLLGIEGLRLKLNDRFKVLTSGARLAPPRHQTLRAALTWSVSLLSADEQIVFRRLSVFAGSMSLSMAQTVASCDRLDEWTVLEHLAALVDKSLVLVELVAEKSASESVGAPRYKLLESQRVLAAEMLNEAGEADEIERRHAHAVLDHFESSNAQYWLAPLDSLLQNVQADTDNLRAALAWAAGLNSDSASVQHRINDRAVLIALAGAAWWLWKPSLLTSEGVRWCLAAMAMIDVNTPSLLEARLLYGFAAISHKSAADKELPALQRAAELYRQTDHRLERYHALALLSQKQAWRDDLSKAATAAADAASAVFDEAAKEEGWPAPTREALLVARTYIYEAAGRPADGQPLMEELVAIMRELGDTRRLDAALIQLAESLFVQGKAAEAIRIRSEVAERIDQGLGLARVDYAVTNLGNLCGALTFHGDVEAAMEAMRRVLPLLRRADKLATFSDHFALLSCKRGRFADAARILAWTDVGYQHSGFDREVSERRARDSTLEMLKKVLSPIELDRVLSAGAVMSEDEIFRMLLSD